METVKLYNGEVELKFDPITHTYTVDGEIVLGVTSITGVLDKPALLYWVNNTDMKYLEEALKVGMRIDEISKVSIISGMKGLFRKRSGEAADIGTAVHAYLEKYLKAGINKEPLPPMPVNELINKSVQAFLDWTKENNVKFLSSEKKIYSKQYKYAGTLDAEAMVDGKYCIVDFKTSSGIYPEMFIQTAAYAKAIEEEMNKKVAQVWILRIPKDGSEFEYAHNNNIDIYFKSFLGCHENYKRMMWEKSIEIEKKKIKLSALQEV
jgi:hypothetical protein